MTRIVSILAAAFIVSALVACAGEAPQQTDGVTVQKKMSQADAQKLIDDLNQAGPICHARAGMCSYSAPDADGNVIFEANINCSAPDGCPLLKAESNCN